MVRLYAVVAPLFLASHGLCFGNPNGNGLIGYGKYMYYPLCAASCRATIEKAPLTCTPLEVEESGGHGHGTTPPECYAANLPFMQTLALCISERCKDDYTPDVLETYWHRHLVAGARPKWEPMPTMSYAEALASLEELPTEAYISGEMLEKTSLISDDDWLGQWNALGYFEQAETGHQRWSLVVLLCGFIVPIGLSLLRFIPFPAKLRFKFNAIFNYPALIGNNHRVPACFGLGLMPTRGQALFIFYLCLLNIVVCAADYHASPQPNAWFSDTPSQIVSYFGNRTGAVSFANIALLLLYSSRNNLLLWVTDWSHTTYLLLHRWVGYIAILQAAIHSLTLLYVYIGSHDTESKLPYWYWGIIATLSMCIIWPLSYLPVRRAMYEFFLLSHIFLAILTLVGCYLHIWYLYGHYWGYEIWIYTAGAVWGLDRIVRVWRFLRHGVRRAQITLLDGDYVRLDVEGVVAHGHVFLYFPTLTWRFWENHPFSVASSFAGHSRQSRARIAQAGPTADEEKQVKVGVSDGDAGSSNSDIASTGSTPEATPRPLLSVLARIRGGITGHFARHAGKSIPVLVESSYHNANQTAELNRCTTLICVVGGVGISTVLPISRTHPGSRARLYWGMRNESLKHALANETAGLDVVYSVGARLDLASIVMEELCRKDEGGEIGLVVSGPEGMADDVRRLMCEVGASGSCARGVVFMDESFSW